MPRLAPFDSGSHAQGNAGRAVKQYGDVSALDRTAVDEANSEWRYVPRESMDETNCPFANENGNGAKEGTSLNGTSIVERIGPIFMHKLCDSSLQLGF